MTDRPLLAFRTVQAATLGALVWKIQFFTTIGRIYEEIPLRQELFPPFFEAAATFSASYAAVILLLSLLLIVQGAAARRLLSGATLLTLSILCIHQGSYNDATFTTAWWAALWSTWFASRMGDGSPEALLRNGARLSQAIVGMVLLGGAAGKWTSEYWSGQVFYEIYFINRDFWFFNALRAGVDPDTLRTVATWYSRSVILVESICGLLLWALPARVAAATGAAVCIGIALFSNFYLVSVVLSLVGLASVGWLVGSAATPGTRPGQALP